MSDPKIIRPDGGVYKPTGKNIEIGLEHATMIATLGCMDAIFEQESTRQLAIALKKQPKELAGKIKPKEVTQAINHINRIGKELVQYLEAHEEGQDG